MTPSSILPAARRDIAEARAWYEKRSAGPGDEFLAKVETALQSIQCPANAANACLANAADRERVTVLSAP